MREILYKQIQVADGTGTWIYDPTSVDFSQFQWTNGYIKHYITPLEISKPYLISYSYYGAIDYEDIILLVNNIANIFDVVPGMEIKIPNATDIKNFILKFRA